MTTTTSPETAKVLQTKHGLSESSIALLLDKNFDDKDFSELDRRLSIPDETFQERRKRKQDLETILDRGDSPEITTGRYAQNNSFEDISSEQAMVQGRMKAGVEYVISVSDLIMQSGVETDIVQRSFTDEEKDKLRGIYKNFRTKDYLVVKLLEKKIDHDIVAPNAWIVILAQLLGIDANLMRKITHLFRTSADVNTNVAGELYMKAVGKWTETLGKLVSTLAAKAQEYKNITCVAQTHGQDAQFTTLGHIYANLAEQIKQHAKPFLGEDKLTLDGKIAGAIGTDVDWVAALPNINPQNMYKHLVEDIFGLKYVELGNDQDCSNASLSQMLDTMTNVGLVLKKAATDVWIYASRGILAKKTEKGNSGSSAMPQKTNPFFAESAEALMSISSAMYNPIKEMMVAYREQGDLRRSITQREGFHPIMLSIIGMNRIIGELNKYSPNIVAIENQINTAGASVASSAISNYLRAHGVPDAYDRIKGIVMKPFVKTEEVESYINGMVENNELKSDAATHIKGMLASVMDDGTMARLQEGNLGSDAEKEIFAQITKRNSDIGNRASLLGNSVAQTERMIENSFNTIVLLDRYRQTR